MDQGSPTLLLIDDDAELGDMLSDFFAGDDITLRSALSGEDGLERVAAEPFDLIILDIMMPGMNGLDVLRKLRQRNQVPVIMLTARGDDIDRIIGLEIGADDYLAKPFNPRELLARARAILRRTGRSSSQAKTLRAGAIEMDTRNRTASVSGTSLLLTGTEFEILRCLLATPGEVVSKEALSQKALGRRLLPYDRSIDTHISNIRSKLEKSDADSASIRSQRGVGYLLLPGSSERP